MKGPHNLRYYAVVLNSGKSANAVSAGKVLNLFDETLNLVTLIIRILIESLVIALAVSALIDFVKGRN